MWLLSSGPDGNALIWDVATGTELVGLRGEGFARPLNVAIFSPDDAYVVAGAEDGGLLLFDLAGKILLDRRMGESLMDLCFTAHGDLIVAAGGAGHFCLPGKSLDGEPRWRTRSASRVATAGSMAACARGLKYADVELRDIETGECVGTLPRPGEKHRDVGQLAFSPDGELLAGVANGLVRMWDVGKRAQVAAWSCSTHFNQVAFTVDGSRLAAVGNDGLVHYWATSSHAEVGTYDWEMRKLTCLAFSPNGCTGAVGSESGAVLIWDLE